MEGYLGFFIIIAAGLLFSEIFKKLHLPFVSALIISGILVGPFFKYNSNF